MESVSDHVCVRSRLCPIKSVSNRICVRLDWEILPSPIDNVHNRASFYHLENFFQSEEFALEPMDFL